MSKKTSKAPKRKLLGLNLESNKREFYKLFRRLDRLSGDTGVTINDINADYIRQLSENLVTTLESQRKQIKTLREKLSLASETETADTIRRLTNELNEYRDRPTEYKPSDFPTCPQKCLRQLRGFYYCAEDTRKKNPTNRWLGQNKIFPKTCELCIEQRKAETERKKEEAKLKQQGYDSLGIYLVQHPEEFVYDEEAALHGGRPADFIPVEMADKWNEPRKARHRRWRERQIKMNGQPPLGAW